jgi:pimeloyl-ACP methyl ester carboxylesterase
LLDRIDNDTHDYQSWTLAGHSMGASTLLAMSNQNPARLSALVMIDGAVTKDMHRLPFLFDSPIGQWMKVYLRYGAIKRSKVKEFLSSAYAKEADDEAVEGYLAPLLIDKTPSALVDFVKTAKNVSIHEWKNPEIPLLVTWGDKDTWVKFTSIDAIRKVARDVQVDIFQGAGHCPHATVPEFNDVLIIFLNCRSR